MFRFTCKILFSIFLTFLVNTEVSGSQCGWGCPTLPPNTVGPCVELCPSAGCDFGYLCCSNGCGHVCKIGIWTCY
uniref:Foot protein 19 n=1 Tax=Mytilus californianus TaxID=6549 RepID=A0A223HCK5_MYTCA|nr:foot protein 19 [Mytilus californianus]